MFGCSIGMFYSGKMGFVGFLVELKNLNDGFKCGFFIVVYVVFNLLNYEKLIDNYYFFLLYKIDYVVYLLYLDD